MGIVNVTPDSFFEGSRVFTESEILHQVEKMLSEGAAIIDVGGYSSRPGATDVSLDEELERTVHAIKIIRTNFPTAILSVDTFRSEVARQSVLEGAAIVNDISGGMLDANMLDTVANLKVPYILMHMRGAPQTMSGLATYENMFTEIATYFSEKIHALHQRGINDIIIDPGFGFAKTIDQNFQLLSHLEYFKIHNKPILAGLSRKSMIWKTLEVSPHESLNGTTALNIIALEKGASILRVHDVKAASETIKLFLKLH
jgi:dihydropteroate synthase